ncbi:BTB and MATH domain-containing protein 36-like isoform X2 [Stylophora pistillata]|uniref:BTB and MATH domain-containing protein 36-like isoform X2 n=1 Tax=Stylophora pistillata TaxID=50429 RepID=UPI000C049BB8|nr:BTB and MATH domain-containing protein 36-like isoform X2 [Stylophora pistillata]
MASSVTEETECKVENSAVDEVTVQDAQEKEKVRHCFSEPWVDSDVILVVENEKFHVHRQILSLNSPVFEAMFKSQFKEATANEIPLPGKKPNEVLDFLLKVYGPHYTKTEVHITMGNVEHLLHLSDEYQVTEPIFKPCVKFLDEEPKTKENVMRILSLAELFNLEKVRQDCNDVLKGMSLETLSDTVQFQNIDRDKLQHFLTQRIEFLEGLLKEVYPQFIGLAECCMWLWGEANKGLAELCPIHYSDEKPATNLVDRFKECHKCRYILERIATRTCPKRRRGRFLDYSDTYGTYYTSRHRFDDKVSTIINKFSQVMTQSVKK